MKIKSAINIRSLCGTRLQALFAPLVVFLLSSGVAVADQGASRGAALAQACATCHGPDGRSQGAIPSIDALSRENLVAMLQAFRTGERQGTVMNRIAKGLDEADVEAVATHFPALQRQ
jgi:sulfide dehydrogenase cytochrome subunit